MVIFFHDAPPVPRTALMVPAKNTLRSLLLTILRTATITGVLLLTQVHRGKTVGVSQMLRKTCVDLVSHRDVTGARAREYVRRVSMGLPARMSNWELLRMIKWLGWFASKVTLYTTNECSVTAVGSKVSHQLI